MFSFGTLLIHICCILFTLSPGIPVRTLPVSSVQSFVHIDRYLHIERIR